MKIAILGAGNIGGTLGAKWAAAGHAVVFGVRDPDTPKARVALETAGQGARLDSLAEAYGKQGEAQRQARTTRNKLENSRIEQIFQTGLHEFCESIIAENARLGAAISEQYLV